MISKLSTGFERVISMQNQWNEIDVHQPVSPAVFDDTWSLKLLKSKKNWIQKTMFGSYYLISYKVNFSKVLILQKTHFPSFIVF